MCCCCCCCRVTFSSMEIKRVPLTNLELILWCYLPNPSARAGCDTRSNFKQSLTGLNSEFSFSWTSCLTKAEELSLPYYLPIAGGRIISQEYLCYVKCNQSRPGFELVSPCSFPKTVTIKPRASPHPLIVFNTIWENPPHTHTEART